jgi:hypothetical protein
MKGKDRSGSDLSDHNPIGGGIAVKNAITGQNEHFRPVSAQPYPRRRTCRVPQWNATLRYDCHLHPRLRQRHWLPSLKPARVMRTNHGQCALIKFQTKPKRIGHAFQGHIVERGPNPTSRYEETGSSSNRFAYSGNDFLEFISNGGYSSNLTAKRCNLSRNPRRIRVDRISKKKLVPHR